MEALGVAVYITDAEGRLTFYNEAAAELWGWRPPLGETRWCGSWKLYWPDGTPLDHADCPMGVALREGRTVRGAEAVAERPDGTRVPFIPYPTPLRDAAGALIGAVNVLVDISGRKAAEAALAGSEARLRAIVETTPECIKLVAPEGTLLQMNAAGLRMIEAGAPEEAEGRSVFDLVAPEHRAGWQANHRRVCSGEALGWEFDVVGLRGTRRSMETHASPLRLPDGRLAHLAITRDVTARKRAEEKQALLAARWTIGRRTHWR
jgi:PAS domain S-box-containing protein